MDVEQRIRRRRLRQRLFSIDDEPVKLGRYEVEERIGSGAMGIVYRARDDRLDRLVAVKLLRRSDDVSARRLEREARALAQLSHPNVVVAHEVGEDDGRTFMAMEFVDGPNLRAWSNGDQTLPARLEVLAGATRGVMAAHAAGFLHRDIKPENILIGRDDRVRVVDFGLARPRGDVEPTESATPSAVDSDRLTRTGHLVGTPAYMAPELLAGEVATERSDQFSLCCVAWELLLGSHPFPDPGGRSEPASPRAGGLPRATITALKRGLSPEPHHRHDDLQPLLAIFEQPSSRWRPAGIGLAGAILGGAAVWMMVSPASVDEKVESDAIETAGSQDCEEMTILRPSVLTAPALVLVTSCAGTADSAEPANPTPDAATDSVSSPQLPSACLDAVGEFEGAQTKLPMLRELLFATAAQDPNRPDIHLQIARAELSLGNTTSGCGSLDLCLDGAAGDTLEDAESLEAVCCHGPGEPVRPQAYASGCTQRDAEPACLDGSQPACCVNAAVAPSIEAKTGADAPTRRRAAAKRDRLLELGCRGGNDESCKRLEKAKAATP